MLVRTAWPGVWHVESAHFHGCASRLRSPGRLWSNVPVGDFSIDTAVAGAAGRYVAHLSRDWEIWGPNGGYTAAIALRAAGAAATLRRPASFACHYVSVAEFDAVDLTVTSLRAAKRAASLRVAMTQKGRLILEALVWVVDDALQGLQHDELRMPDVPLPDQLKSIEELVAPQDRVQRY